jgi:CheY-like chemotaxis protein
MEPSDFARLVREALSHLYDHVYLESHPLAVALLAGPADDVAGLTLHRVLVEALEALRPSADVPMSALAWRSYLVLSMRYLRDMQPSQIAEELSISPRQFRRDQLKGLDELTSLLWKRYQALHNAPNGQAPAQSLLQAEVGRLDAASAGAFTSLEGTIRGVAATLVGLAAQYQVSLVAEFPAALPLVSADRVMLRQVLLNVLTHLIERGGGSIAISGRVSGPYIQVGIAYRGANPAAPDTLRDDRMSVAAHLLEMQGGQMDIKAGDQLAIVLLLPVRKPPTVLVIDDNADVIQLFRRYLGGGAYAVVGATSGDEALRLARELRPQVITLDVMMPNQDGWEILQSLKALPATKDIPVIVCTVLRERQLALSLGAAGFLAKPVTQEALLTILARSVSAQAGASDRGRP